MARAAFRHGGRTQQRRQGEGSGFTLLEELGAIQTDPAEGMALPALGAHAAIVEGEKVDDVTLSFGERLECR